MATSKRLTKLGDDPREALIDAIDHRGAGSYLYDLAGDGGALIVLSDNQQAHEELLRNSRQFIRNHSLQTKVCNLEKAMTCVGGIMNADTREMLSAFLVPYEGRLQYAMAVHNPNIHMLHWLEDQANVDEMHLAKLSPLLSDRLHRAVGQNLARSAAPYN